MKPFLVQLFRTVVRHNLGGLAAIVSYFAFSSMIPVLLLLVYAASRFVPATDVERAVTDLLHAYVPALPQEMSFVSETVHRLDKVGPEISIIGIAASAWNTIGGFVSLQWILDTIWGIKKRRSFLRQYFVGFIMLTVLAGLTVVSALAAETVRLLATHPSGMLLRAIGLTSGELRALLPFIHAVAVAVFPVLLFGTCFVIYTLLPTHVPPLLARLIGAAVATAGIFVSRSLFLIYTHHLRNYEAMYGALSFIMLLTFWIYIVSFLLLFGAAVIVAFETAGTPPRARNTQVRWQPTSQQPRKSRNAGRAGGERNPT